MQSRSPDRLRKFTSRFHTQENFAIEVSTPNPSISAFILIKNTLYVDTLRG